MDLSEILDEAFRMYRANFVVFFGVSLILAVPGVLMNLGFGRRQGFAFYASAFGNASNPVNPAFTTPGQLLASVNLPLVIAGGLLALVMIPVTMGARIAAATSIAHGEEVTLPSALTRTLSRYWALFGISALLVLIYAGAVLILVLLALIPVIGIVLLFLGILGLLPVALWVLIRWVLVVPALLEEGLSPVRSFSRSSQLVSGSWWRVFGILLLTGLVVGVIGLAAGALTGILALLIPGLDALGRASVLVVAQAIATAAITPISSIVTVLLYYDLRVRKEALDLDILARAAASNPPPGGDFGYAPPGAPPLSG